MHLYLVMSAEPTLTTMIRETHPKLLISYANDKELGPRTSMLETPGSRLLVDSGAFTAFTLGKQLDTHEYAQWAQQLKLTIPPETQTHFFNLDVIGDQEATWRNHETLTTLGFHTIPVVTQGAHLKHVDRAINEHEYFALGGLVPLARYRTRLQAWLDAVFARVIKHYKSTGVMRRVHLLGITQQWALNRYPVYSSDSSSWLKPRRFGWEVRPGLTNPRAADSQATALHGLRNSVNEYKNMEAVATQLWEKRGITWNK